PIMLGFVFATLFHCWPRLSAPQRYLGYGVMLCGAAGLIATTMALLNHEKTLDNIGIIGDCMVLLVFLLFSTGLKEEMRQHEVVKQATLKTLNELQLQQNTILEKRVEERTDELRVSNRR